MNLWLFSAGFIVIGTMLVDLLLASFSATGSGPVTHRLASSVVRLFRAVARVWRPLLRGTGVAAIGSTLCTWWLGTLLGWWLVFSALPRGVVRDGTMATADALERLYFVGSTVFTLGMGDYVPSGHAGQVLSTAASFNGVLVLMMAVAFLIASSQANDRRRTHARLINDLGRNAQTVVIGAWDGRSVEQLTPHLRALGQLVTQGWEYHRAYPFLGFVQPASRRASFEANVAVLDELVLILEYGLEESVRPHPMVLGPLRLALDRFVDTATSNSHRAPVDTPAAPALDSLRHVGIPTVTDEEFRQAVASRCAHRERLARLVADTPWAWADGVDTVGSNGSSNR